MLSEHRSRLTSKMLEALMCSQDWLRNKYKVIINDWFTSSTIYFSKCLLNGRKLILLHFVVDEKSKQQATFWFCLQDIQEGLQVTFLSLGPIFYIG